jgi:tetratricopeptide (TPR) repeat protein
MSFNNFLSTSYDRTVGLCFARRSLDDPNLMGILCVMKIDPSKSTKLFAYIGDISYYPEEEEEVLFSMHTVFRIDAIKPMNENQRLFQVDLTLTSEDDKDLRILTNRIREETFPQSSGWYRLGSMLIKMGQPDLAEQVYQVLLDETIDDSKKASIYHQLGVVKYDRREYKEAIIFYEKSLQIRKKLLPPDHPDLAKCYNNIGNVYGKIGERQKALSFYEKALQIKQQSLPSNDISLAASYCNIGSLYGEMRDYAKALPYFEKDLEISKKSLSSNDPDLATSYSNLAVAYENLGYYLEARSYYQHAIDIGQQSLPPNHPDLQKWKRNLDKIKKKS